MVYFYIILKNLFTTRTTTHLTYFTVYLNLVFFHIPLKSAWKWCYEIDTTCVAYQKMCREFFFEFLFLSLECVVQYCIVGLSQIWLGWKYRNAQLQYQSQNINKCQFNSTRIDTIAAWIQWLRMPILKSHYRQTTKIIVVIVTRKVVESSLHEKKNNQPRESIIQEREI